MLLVVTYSRAARQTLRNTCRAHEDAVVRRFGRAVLFEATEFGAFLALRLRERHGDDVQIERTEPLNEYRDAPDRVLEAVEAYEREAHDNTPYAKFAADTDYPSPDAMRGQPI